MNQTELRTAVIEMFHAALKAVDAQAAVQKAVSLQHSNLRVVDRQFDLTSRQLYAVAIGKAALGMAKGLMKVLGSRISAGVISAPNFEPDSTVFSQSWQVFSGGHPFPNTESLAAAQATTKLLQNAEVDRAIVIFLISGGGSAALEWPSNPAITLEELIQANRTLVLSGATIGEINTVRRALSAAKGGRLALVAPSTTQVSLIISDVNPGEDALVASGPTMVTQTSELDPRKIVDRYELRHQFPESVMRTIDEVTDPVVALPMEDLDQSHYVLLDNHSALETIVAEARSRGFRTGLADDIVEQPIEAGCQLLLTRLQQLKHQTSEPVCLISGGEFGCPVRGQGVGGRNLETALRCALDLDKSAGAKNVLIFSGATDGIDGNSPAAGALADQATIARGRARSLDAKKFLAESDSFSFFHQLGDAIITGPTGTNVRDVRIILSN